MSRSGYYSNNINLNNIYQPYSTDLNLSTLCVGNDVRNFSSQFAVNISGALRIYETTGSGDSYNSSSNGTSSIGTLVLSHGDSGGKSSIIFPSKNDVASDYGYIIYRDSYTDGTGQRSRLEIGTENDFGPGSLASNDCLILQKNGGYVGIGTITPSTTLDVSGTINSTIISTTNISTSTTLTIGTFTQTGNTILNANSSTGNILFNSPIYINHSLALTSFNQIGYFYGTFTPTGYTNYSSLGTNTKYASTSSPVPVTLPIGVYILSASISYNCTAGATAGVLSSIYCGYSSGTNNTYSNSRTNICSIDSSSPFFISANTSRTVNAENHSYTATIQNTSATNYISPVVAVIIGTAFTGGTIGANINAWQLCRIG